MCFALEILPMTITQQNSNACSIQPAIIKPDIGKQYKEIVNDRFSDELERHQKRYQLSPHNQIFKQTRQNKILTEIRRLFGQLGRQPRISEIKKAARCTHGTGSTALAVFKQELEAKENLQSILIYVKDREHKVRSSITIGLQELIDDSTYALFDKHNNKDIYLITLACPGNAEEPYLAMSINSESIISSVIDDIGLLLPEDFELDYIYAWEVQDRGSPHVHILLNLPNGHTVTQDKLTNIWLTALDEVGKEYNINMYSNRSIPDYCLDSPNVFAHTAHIEPFYLRQNNYPCSYLAKQKSKTPRVLSIAGNRAIGFQKWGGISTSLKSYAEGLRLIEKIPVDTRDDAFDAIEAAKSLVESVVSADWEDHVSPYTGKLGYKTRIDPTDFKRVRNRLEQQAIALYSRHGGPYAQEAINSVVFELHPSGHCVLRHSFSRANYQIQQQQYKNSRRRR
jgi:hypothetical protein